MTQRNQLVTFVVFAYNQERFIAEAVRGALSQTYSPLEILFSDDCSTDRTFEIIQQEVSNYRGQHKIIINRNARNLGFGTHINRVMEIVNGQLIVAAAGDDVSLPERVAKLYTVYESAKGKTLALFSNAIVIDESGNQDSLYLIPPDPKALSLDWMAKRGGGALGCAQAWDRKVFELFGQIDEAVIHEDLVIPFRAALVGKVEFLSQPLVLYRRHTGNIHFKEVNQVKGAGQLQMALLKHTNSLIAVYNTRLRDIDTAQRLFPERRQALLGVHQHTLKGSQEVRNHQALLLSDDPFKRLAIIAKAIIRGTRFRVVVRWILTFFFPQLYLYYQERLRNKTRRQSRMRD
ncbi:MAG: glycosyltransferase [Acidobacteriota bacterium]